MHQSSFTEHLPLTCQKKLHKILIKFPRDEQNAYIVKRQSLNFKFTVFTVHIQNKNYFIVDGVCKLNQTFNYFLIFDKISC